MPLSFYAKIERTRIANEKSILGPSYICNNELVLSIYVVVEMLLPFAKKEQFQKEVFSSKVKIAAGIMIVLLFERSNFMKT